MAAERPDAGDAPRAAQVPGVAGPVDAAAPGGSRDGLSELDAAARLRSGPPAKARQAASVIVVRDGEPGLEVLLVKRNPAARFMGGVWVFPGGAVDAGEGEGDRAHRAAAVRELGEEAGVHGVDPEAIVKFSRWITPAELAVRFDTHFFIAPLPPGEEVRIDGHECVADAWLTPQAALDAHADGRIVLVFPTIRQLEQLRDFTTVGALLDHARARQVSPARPRILVSGDDTRLVMPGEPGYDPS
jgi:8-oxo-dGTP pyrophosphatase MutT (NUDIX family)